MLRHFQSAISAERGHQASGQTRHFTQQPVDHGRRICTRHLDEGHVSRRALDERRDMTVLGAGQQIALSMAGDGAVLDRRRPFGDGDGIDDLSACLPDFAGPLSATYRPARPQVGGQLALQDAARAPTHGRHDAPLRAHHRVDGPHVTTERPPNGREGLPRLNRVHSSARSTVDNPRRSFCAISSLRSVTTIRAVALTG